METQTSLFNNNLASNKPTSLFVMKDGKPAHMVASQIFDSHRFTEVRAITFSASGGFITKYLSKFKNIYMIEGLPDYNQLENSRKNMNKIVRNAVDKITDSTFSNNLIQFLNHLNNSIREKIVRKHFDLRVPVADVIHSKIYLLSNPKTHETRVIKGSANLSYPAMSAHNNQYEDLDIWDNNKAYYDYNLRYFNQLKPMTDTYLGKYARELTKKQVKAIDPKHPKQQAQITAHQADQIKKDQAVKAFSDIQHRVDNGTASKADLKAFKHYVQSHPNLEKQAIMAAGKRMAAMSVVQNAVSKNKNKVGFKSTNSIKRSIAPREKKYVLHIHKTTGKTHIKHFQFPVVVDRPEQRQAHDDDGIMIDDHGMLRPYNKNVSTKDIKHDLLVINALAKSYDKYAYHAGTEYQSRPLEAILYTLTAIFLGDIRHQVPSGQIRNVPLFFFIGGAPKTGKTSLLKFLMKMLGFYPLDTEGIPIVKRYSDMPISGSGNIGRKTGIINSIHDIMTSSYVTPLMINEIDDTFNYKNNGSNLIVRTMGEFGDYPNRQFSPLIGVTNNTNYNLGHRAKDGRSYYLSLSKHISNDINGSRLITKLIQSMTNNLFIDFSHHFSDLLEKGTIRKTYDDAMTKDNKFDFLHWSRIILINEYKRAGLTVPDYFPKHLYDDSETIGKSKWRVFYVNHYNQFNDDPTSKNSMSISTSCFVNRGGRHNNAATYMNLLPSPSVCQNTSTRTNEIILNKTNFFNWIDLNESTFKKAKHQQKLAKIEQNILDKKKASHKAGQELNKNVPWWKKLL